MEGARLISRFLRNASPAAHPDVVYSPVLASTSFLTVIACSLFVSWCVLLQLFSAAPAPPWVILLSHHYLPCTSSSAHCLVLRWECSREQQSLPSSHTCFLLFSSVCISVCRLQHLFSCFPFFFLGWYWSGVATAIGLSSSQPEVDVDSCLFLLRSHFV